MSVELLIDSGLRACRNPAAAPAAEPYGSARAQVLSQAGFDAAEHEIRQWPGYRATPLRTLPALARQLDVASVMYKDEGARFELKSFKALGGAYAVYRLLEKAIMAHNGGQPVPVADVLSGRWSDVARMITVTCATDGNHGRSVAWGAQAAAVSSTSMPRSAKADGRPSPATAPRLCVCRATTTTRCATPTARPRRTAGPSSAIRPTRVTATSRSMSCMGMASCRAKSLPNWAIRRPPTSSCRPVWAHSPRRWRRHSGWHGARAVPGWWSSSRSRPTVICAVRRPGLRWRSPGHSIPSWRDWPAARCLRPPGVRRRECVCRAR